MNEQAKKPRRLIPPTQKTPCYRLHRKPINRGNLWTWIFDVG